MLDASRDRRPLLLVTGFGPFPLMPRNPSAALANAVACNPALRRAGIDARSLVLPTTYDAIDAVLLPALARLNPDALLMLGVAGRRRAVCVEQRAQNRVSRLFPDAQGQSARSLEFRSGGPAKLRIAANGHSLLRSLRSQRVPAQLSRDAGRYLCNASYYAALAQRDDPGLRTAFVHIPLPRRGVRDERPSMLAMQVALVALSRVLAHGLSARALDM